MRLATLRVLLMLVVAPAACETHFTGDPHYPGGPRGCHDDCARQGMEMSSFIYSGEFATSCAPAPSARRDDRDVEDAAAVGVVLQQRRKAEQSRPAPGEAH